jgi:hypothetical protein
MISTLRPADTVATLADLNFAAALVVFLKEVVR